MQNLVLIPIGTVIQNVADFLSLSLPEILNAPCKVLEEEVALEPFYSNDRKQYHSTEILRQLLPFAKDKGQHILGIIDEDLYIPILTFVFGEAQLGGRCALMSGHRLHQEFYGLPQCSNFECVMRYSNSVADIDIKRNVFCPSCSEVLGIPSLW
jgi:archaemetzincin